MKVAVIADIHSNIDALRAVVQEIKVIVPDMVLCAGDVVGYGAYPNECCRTVQQIATRCVQGNHDISVLRNDMSWMNPHAATAAVWTSVVMDAEERAYLASLRQEEREEAEGVRVAVFHGSPRSPDEYIYEGMATEGLLTAADCDVLVLGHTHVPFTARFRKGLIMNPGSVGQPRDGDPRASFAVLDTATKECVFRRVAYDIDRAAKAIRDANLPAFLADRLYLGR